MEQIGWLKTICLILIFLQKLLLYASSGQWIAYA